MRMPLEPRSVHVVGMWVVVGCDHETIHDRSDRVSVRDLVIVIVEGCAVPDDQVASRTNSEPDLVALDRVSFDSIPRASDMDGRISFGRSIECAVIACQNGVVFDPDPVNLIQHDGGVADEAPVADPDARAIGGDDAASDNDVVLGTEDSNSLVSSGRAIGKRRAAMDLKPIMGVSQRDAA